jgi:hypothetical protein
VDAIPSLPALEAFLVTKTKTTKINQNRFLAFLINLRGRNSLIKFMISTFSVKARRLHAAIFAFFGETLTNSLYHKQRGLVNEQTGNIPPCFW